MGNSLRINFTGASGVGKTTLAKWLSDKLGIPFVSASYSDLIPETRHIPHEDMIYMNPQTIFEQDNQALNLRHKNFNLYENYVSDRSHIDSAAYIINKLSPKLPQCSIDDFIMNAVYHCMATDVTHLIFLDYSINLMNTWLIEDNKKRIKNKYYQFQISRIIYGILDLFDMRYEYTLKDEYTIGSLSIPLKDNIKHIEILILETPIRDIREKHILDFINGKL